MPTLTLNRGLPGFEMTSTSIMEGLVDLEYSTRTATRLTLLDEGDRINFIGTGLSYSMDGDQIVGVPTGTVSRVHITYGSSTILDWTGLGVSANRFFTLVATENWTGLNTLLLGRADAINLTNAADVVRGFGGNDTIKGFGGADRLMGDAGNDKLWGMAGADTLVGGAGADTLLGGLGVDRLAGGAGADVFAFVNRGAANRDIITDFNRTADDLHFDNDAFSAFAYTGRLRAADFVLGTAATDAADRFVYQRATGNLWYDADGSGAGAKMLVAELRDGTALTAADIFIL